MEAVVATTRDNSSMARDRWSRAAAEATLEFGRFRVLLRQRQLVADGVPIELGTRALDLLLVAGDRRIAGRQGRAYEPCVARHRCRGGEPEGSNLRVAQGSW